MCVAHVVRLVEGVLRVACYVRLSGSEPDEVMSHRRYLVLVVLAVTPTETTTWVCIVSDDDDLFVSHLQDGPVDVTV